ncbi:hypothetical protein LX32DRAFT_207751 [Colletotrichum zoysiae]|uniref:Uncharacterized protein n=1 Tax=Colletotrichum zoysiae TaxID=1216348 RepID=A0AAD9HNC6_9PEZI|nr:hypothetical protein LX32DRAFT_207751 [Colletotrichum zoysiae]
MTEVLSTDQDMCHTPRPTNHSLRSDAGNKADTRQLHLPPPSSSRLQDKRPRHSPRKKAPVQATRLRFSGSEKATNQSAPSTLHLVSSAPSLPRLPSLNSATHLRLPATSPESTHNCEIQPVFLAQIRTSEFLPHTRPRENFFPFFSHRLLRLLLSHTTN